jgi:hypothetical protein
MFAPVGAATPGKVTAIVTRRIWQDGQRLTLARAPEIMANPPIGGQ